MRARPGGGKGPGARAPGWAVIPAQTKAACLARLDGRLGPPLARKPLPPQVLPGLGPRAPSRYRYFADTSCLGRRPVSSIFKRGFYNFYYLSGDGKEIL